ncbi:MAG TPA: PBP1A family penicillin-binding protein [Candidatus Deferrimicrobiaceae bacterium]
MARTPSFNLPSRSPRKTGFALVVVAAAIGACLLLAGLIGFLLLAKFGDFPSIHSAAAYRPSVSSKIFDRNNKIVGEIYLEKRTLVPFEAIPPHVVNAFVAAEDAHFFKHKGVDYLAILRAVVKDVLHGGYAQGASTITQQTVKSLFLTPEKSVQRKMKELILAYRIEKAMSKEEILYLYLNQIYLGDGAYGVEAAARTYFNKGVGELSVAEGALLAGLAQAPTRYSPRQHLDLAKMRQKYVLRRMAEVGFITASQAEASFGTVLKIAPPSTFRSKAAYFLEYVRVYLQDKYGADAIYKSQLNIYTTIDGRMQEAADDAVTQGLKKLEADRKLAGIQGALIAIDPHTGGVLSMVGGADFAQSQFNRALQAKRQPGSAFKPIVYAAAIEKGKTVVSTVDDSPIEFEKNETEMWKPRNYDGTFLGPITMLEALAKSRNLATVRLLSEIGVDAALDMARALGIQSPIERNLSIALGSASVSPIELCTVYSTFASLGERPTPYFIREVRDGAGNVLEKTTPQITRTVSPETAYLSVRLMQEVVRSGTAASAKWLGSEIAGKTGTTNDSNDAWFVGFSPDIAAAVWVGFDTPKPLGHGSAASIALPIWTSYMGRALGATPRHEFPVPPGITFAHVDPSTAKVLPSGSTDGIMLPFKLGTVPEPGAGGTGDGAAPKPGQADDLL